MDKQLFVSRYQLELPKKEEMQRFIDEQLQSLNDAQTNMSEQKPKTMPGVSVSYPGTGKSIASNAMACGP